MTGSNRRLPRCKRGALEAKPVDAQELTATPSAACTAACTSEAKSEHGDRLEGFAAELRDVLSADDLTRLAKLLADDPETA